MENAQSLPGVRKLIKKVNDAKSIDAADCGAIFMVKNPTSGTYVITLPTPSVAGKGWHCKFVNANKTATMANIVKIDGAVSTLAAVVVDGGANNSNVAGAHANQFISFAAASVHGDWIEVWTDGNHWYSEGWSSINAGMTTT